MPHEDETHSCVAGAPADLDRPRVVVVWSGGAASALLPERGQLVIGRSATCDLRIDDGSVSREHAVLHAGTPPTLQDLGSSNGTRVAGRPLEPGKPVMLLAGSSAQLGEALLIVQQRTRDEVARAGAALALDAPESDAMAEVQRLADLVATGDISVILRGETGVGKEVLATRIHEGSPRAEGPFLKLNCAAFSESMVEAELFGHERGAFTGAAQAKPGLLETAEGGTVLLDEVGELSLSMQAKLLRAIGSREVLRVGATRPRPIDVRFLAATHRDIEGMVERGAFRADLYFRLNGISLHIPPLRERRRELEPLAEAFVREGSEKLGMAPPPLGAAARAALHAHAFPGNVRELRSVIERALLLCRGAPLAPEHLGLAKGASTRPAAPVPRRGEPRLDEPSLRDDMQRLELERIQAALHECGGNQTKAALKLGISRRALLHRLDAYALPRPRKGPDESGHG